MVITQLLHYFCKESELSLIKMFVFLIVKEICLFHLSNIGKIQIFNFITVLSIYQAVLLLLSTIWPYNSGEKCSNM